VPLPNHHMDFVITTTGSEQGPTSAYLDAIGQKNV